MMAGIAAATMALSAPAQARPDTTRMSCPAARDMVSRYGAIVMNTGGHTFDRFVSNRGYCTPQEDIKPAFVPDRNGRSCFVGYTCEPIEPPEHFD
ncbi:MAG: hypothetical protein KDJ29_09615 [Hyphomicrobiales bacterium]|nr:hypothetical protein [Hyphomicrobiales bacterium]